MRLKQFLNLQRNLSLPKWTLVETLYVVFTFLVKHWKHRENNAKKLH